MPPSSSSFLPRWIILSVLITAAAVPVYMSAFRVYDVGRDRFMAKRINDHLDVLHTTENANPPRRYRVLVPYTLEAVVRVVALVMPYEKAFRMAYGAFQFFAVVLMLWSQFAYLRRWFTDYEALIACLVITSTMAVNLQQQYSDSSLFEAAFAALVLLCAIDGRHIAAGIVIALASLNRETGLFLVILYAAAVGFPKKGVQPTLAYLGIWAAIFGALRLWLGNLPYTRTTESVQAFNMIPLNLVLGTISNFLFLGPFWIFAVLGFRRAPAFVRRSALMVPPYVAVLLLFTFWAETRPDMTMYPVLLPLALSYLFVPRTTPLTREELYRPSAPRLAS